MGSRGSFSRTTGIGIRTPATYRSDASWLAAHQAGLPWAVVGSLLLTALGVYALLDPQAGGWLGWVGFGLFILSSLVTTIVGSLAARRAGTAHE